MTSPTIVFHHGALGDFVLTFPILRALQGGEVTVIAPASKGQLAAAIFAHVRAYDINHRDCTLLHAPHAAAQIGQPLRAMLTSGRRIVSFVSEASSAWADNITKLAPQAQIIHVQPSLPHDVFMHVCDWHDQQLREQGLDLPHAPAPRADDAGGPVVIHPGSGGRAKCWPVECYLELIAALRRRGDAVRVVLGEVERERWPAKVIEALHASTEVRYLDSLIALKDELAVARLYIGNDSGPTHLAAALGVPTLALFGPTDPGIWAPRGPHVRVLAPTRLQAMRWLDVDTVLATI